MRHALLIGMVCAGLAACGDDDARQAASAPSSSVPAGGAQADAALSPDDKVRICRAATSLVLPTASKTVAGTEQTAAQQVRVRFEPQGGVALNAQCEFSGDQVSWSLAGADIPGANVAGMQPSAAPQALRYRLNGAVVELVQTNPDGSRTESFWSSTEKSLSVGAGAPTGAE